MTANYSMTNQFEQQKNIKAGGYTALTLGLLLLFFFLVSWRIPLPEEPLLNEGIEVNLGNSDKVIRPWKLISKDWHTNLAQRGGQTNDRYGSWSCKNALAEALTCHDVGEVAMHGLFSDVASFPTGGAADADSSRPGQFFNNR